MLSVIKDDEYPQYFVRGLDWIQSISRGDFTYNDYKNWPEDVHAEILDGTVYLMAAPSERHAFIQGEIYGQLYNFLRGKTCTPYTAKFAVRLDYMESGEDKKVVEPDVFVVCNQSIVRDKPACQGVPDFILEIVSRAESKKDLVIKKELYERAGVKEYWVIGQKHLHVFVMSDGKYSELVKELSCELKQPVSCLDGCLIDCFAKGSYPALQGEKKGMNPETNTLPKQHTPSLQGGVVDFQLIAERYKDSKGW